MSPVTTGTDATPRRKVRMPARCTFAPYTQAMRDADTTTVPGIRFVIDGNGKRTAVVIELDQHGELWEDLYDRLLSAQRRNEPREPLAAVTRRMRKPDSRRARA